MNVLLPIPDNLALYFGSDAELSRCAVEAPPLEEYRAGRLTGLSCDTASVLQPMASWTASLRTEAWPTESPPKNLAVRCRI